MAEKTRYSDEELQEFKELILNKLAKAQADYELLKASVNNTEGNDVADTSPTFKVLEEGATTLSKEESGRLAERQMKFIQHLQAALPPASLYPRSDSVPFPTLPSALTPSSTTKTDAVYETI